MPQADVAQQFEEMYGTHPVPRAEADVLFDAGRGLSALAYSGDLARRTHAQPLRITALEPGPFDLVTHVMQINGCAART